MYQSKAVIVTNRYTCHIRVHTWLVGLARVKERERHCCVSHSRGGGGGGGGGRHNKQSEASGPRTVQFSTEEEGEEFLTFQTSFLMPPPPPPPHVLVRSAHTSEIRDPILVYGRTYRTHTYVRIRC